jgi:prepilin-type N-terminal cleavage/methylation domain-containing protein
MHSHPRDRRARRGSNAGTDAGFTLVEVLITVVLMAIVTSAIAAVSITVIRSEAPTLSRIAESKDISYLQAAVPPDVRAATAHDTSPTHQPANQSLPGTNVLTVTRDSATGPLVVSYRYQLVGERWQLVRYEIENAGTDSETVVRTGAAQELAPPPTGWTPDQPATHAASATVRTPTANAGSGLDLTVVFPTGKTFSTGGAGPSPLSELPTDYSGGIADGNSPRSRCGGTMTLVLDTSLSVPMQFGGIALETAATGFIDAFVGTPTNLAVLGFDRRAYVMSPSTGFGQYIELLNPSTAIDAAKARIVALDDRDGTGLVQSDPNRDGIHWNQTNWSHNGRTVWGGTNWEDALWMPFRTDAGTMHEQAPDLVVFITDGDPNRNRSQLSGYNDEDWLGSSAPDGIDPQDVSLAVDAADVGRDSGARVIGVMVGRSANNPASVARLQQVVGPVLWNGTSATDLGNADIADVFIPAGGSFSNLGPTLRAIMASQCGGTVTVQKRIETSPGVLEDATQPWSYTSGASVFTLDPDRDSSVTIDFPFEGGTATRSVTITETPDPGFVFSRVECTRAGNALAPGVQSNPPDGVPGVTLSLRADDAISCVFVSRPR